MSDANKIAKTKPPTSASILYNIVKTNTYYKDESGVIYAEVSVPDGRKELVEVKSEKFSAYLSFEHFKRLSTMPQRNDLQSIIGTLEYVVDMNKVSQVFLRFGYFNDNYYLDLANARGEVVEITPFGWSITTTPPVKFIRPQNQIALPTPVPGGDPKVILEYLNMTSVDQEMFVMAAICSFPLADISRPILGFIGAPGSAKTTSARIIKMTLDPTAPLENDFENKKRELAVVFSHNACPLFDNMVEVRPDISAMLCKGCTGGAFSSRTLFTNSGIHTVSFKRGFIFTALDTPSREPDFLDRCLLIETDEIDKIVRKLETELLHDFQSDLPAILGGILDTIVAARGKLMSGFLVPAGLPRLADFGRFGAAVCDHLGYSKDAFIQIITEDHSRKNNEKIISKSPVAQAIVKLMIKTAKFEGTTATLLKAIMPELILDDIFISVEKLGRELNIIKCSLSKLGIDIDNSTRSAYGKKVVITKNNHFFINKELHELSRNDLDLSADRDANKVSFADLTNYIYESDNTMEFVRCCNCENIDQNELGKYFCQNRELEHNSVLIDDINAEIICEKYSCAKLESDNLTNYDSTCDN